MVDKLRQFGETQVTVSFTFVISIIVAVLTGFCSWQIVQDGKTIAVADRVTSIETCIKGLYSDQTEMKSVLRTIRDDQIMFYRSVNPKWVSTARTHE
jgi:hypothetical protein